MQESLHTMPARQAHAFRVTGQETAEDKRQRLASNRKFRQEKEDKLERLRHGGAKADLEMANICLQLGIDYLTLMDKSKLYELVRQKFDDQRADTLPEDIEVILQDLFSARVVPNPLGVPIIKFPPREGEENSEMKLFSAVAEATGQSRKIVRQVYDALVKEVHHSLKRDRVAKLPELGIIRVAYRKALPKRKGKVPFTGEIKTFPARPASNKLRFRPAKPLKEYVDAKVKVQAPKKKVTDLTQKPVDSE